MTRLRERLSLQRWYSRVQQSTRRWRALNYPRFPILRRRPLARWRWYFRGTHDRKETASPPGFEYSLFQITLVYPLSLAELSAAEAGVIGLLQKRGDRLLGGGSHRHLSEAFTGSLAQGRAWMHLGWIQFGQVVALAKGARLSLHRLSPSYSYLQIDVYPSEAFFTEFAGALAIPLSPRPHLWRAPGGGGWYGTVLTADTQREQLVSSLKAQLKTQVIAFLARWNIECSDVIPPSVEVYAYAWRVSRRYDPRSLYPFSRLIDAQPAGLSLYRSGGLAVYQKHSENLDATCFVCWAHRPAILRTRPAVGYADENHFLEHAFHGELSALAVAASVTHQAKKYLNQLSLLRAPLDAHLVSVSGSRRLSAKHLERLERLGYEFTRWRREVCRKATLKEVLGPLDIFGARPLNPDEKSQLGRDIGWMIHTCVRETRWRLRELVGAYRTRTAWLIQRRGYWLTGAAMLLALFSLLQIIPDDWRKSISQWLWSRLFISSSN